MRWLWIWLCTSAPARAVEPVLDLHALGSLGRQGATEPSGLGIGAGLGMRLQARWSLELAAEGGLSLHRQEWASLTPQARLWLGALPGRHPALSVSLGGGLLASPALHPVLAAGVALDLGGAGSLVPRVQARVLADPRDGDPAALHLGLGLAWPRVRPAEPLPVLATPASNATPSPLDPWTSGPGPSASGPTAPGLPPDEDYVWVPHPVSECVAEGRIRPEGDGAAPLQAVLQPGVLDLEALLHPRGGSLVIVAGAGDEVMVDGHRIPLAPDDTVVMNAAAGPHAVRIRGGGLDTELQPSVADGYATWIRARLPDSESLVLFPIGSSTLGPEARALVTELAGRSGGWRVALTGRFSPEGDLEQNRALAAARAQAVRQALIAAGMPTDRIELRPVEDATLDEDPVRQRSCRISPLRPAPASGTP